MENHSKEELSRMGQASWNRIAEETNLEDLGLSAETISMFRVYYNLGFSRGQESLIDTLKDMYHDDIESFEKIFEPNILH